MTPTSQIQPNSHCALFVKDARSPASPPALAPPWPGVRVCLSWHCVTAPSRYGCLGLRRGESCAVGSAPAPSPTARHSLPASASWASNGLLPVQAPSFNPDTPKNPSRSIIPVFYLRAVSPLVSMRRAQALRATVRVRVIRPRGHSRVIIRIQIRLILLQHSTISVYANLFSLSLRA